MVTENLIDVKVNFVQYFRSNTSNIHRLLNDLVSCSARFQACDLIDTVIWIRILCKLWIMQNWSFNS